MSRCPEIQNRDVEFVVGTVTKIRTASSLYCHEFCDCLQRRGIHQHARCESPRGGHLLAEGPKGIHRHYTCLAAEVFLMDRIMEKAS